MFKYILHDFGAGLCETGVLALFWSLVMRTKVVGIVWGLGYANRGCLRHLGVGIRELRLLALFGVLVMRTRGVYVDWGLGYTN